MEPFNSLKAKAILNGSWIVEESVSSNIRTLAEEREDELIGDINSRKFRKEFWYDSREH